MYTQEEKKKIRFSYLVDALSFADERYLHFRTDPDGKTRYSGRFDYDELLNDYDTDFKNQVLEDDIQQGIEFTPEKIALLNVLNNFLDAYDDKLESDPNLYKNTYVLQDPNWHIVQEKAREVLKAFPETPEVLKQYGYGEEVPRISIIEDKLDDPSYKEDQFKIFVDTVYEITDDQFHETMWRDIEKHCLKGGFFDLYNRFGRKVTTILKNAALFNLSETSKELLVELHQNMERCAEYLGVCYQDDLNYFLSNRYWLETKVTAQQFLDSLKQT